jgi:hypothetical protein
LDVDFKVAGSQSEVFFLSAILPIQPVAENERFKTNGVRFGYHWILYKSKGMHEEILRPKQNAILYTDLTNW